MDSGLLLDASLEVLGVEKLALAVGGGRIMGMGIHSSGK